MMVIRQSITTELFIGDAERSRYTNTNAGRPDAAGHLRALVPGRGTNRRGTNRALRRFATGRLETSGRAEARQTGARPSRRPADALQRAAQRVGAVDRLDESDDRVLAEPVRCARRLAEEDGSMNQQTETLSVVVEREFSFPPERLWRALTQPHLMEEWLMKNDFKPDVGHKLNLRGDWGGVLDCEVLEIEPHKTLSYTWNHAHADAAYN